MSVDYLAKFVKSSFSLTLNFYSTMKGERQICHVGIEIKMCEISKRSGLLKVVTENPQASRHSSA